jgi:hypothetical protein
VSREDTCESGAPAAVRLDCGIWYALRLRAMPSGEKKSTVSWSMTCGAQGEGVA